jgi:hypothetical protein
MDGSIEGPVEPGAAEAGTAIWGAAVCTRGGVLSADSPCMYTSSQNRYAKYYSGAAVNIA